MPKNLRLIKNKTTRK